MTKLERIFELFESYPPIQCQQRIQEAELYLNRGAEVFAKRVRPIDCSMSQDMLKSLETSLVEVLNVEKARFILSSGTLKVNIEAVRKQFSNKQIQGLLLDVKQLHSDLRTILTADEIAIYQRLDEFFDFFESLFYNILQESAD